MCRCSAAGRGVELHPDLQTTTTTVTATGSTTSTGPTPLGPTPLGPTPLPPAPTPDMFIPGCAQLAHQPQSTGSTGSTALPPELEPEPLPQLPPGLFLQATPVMMVDSPRSDDYPAPAMLTRRLPAAQRAAAAAAAAAAQSSPASAAVSHSNSAVSRAYSTTSAPDPRRSYEAPSQHAQHSSQSEEEEHMNGQPSASSSPGPFDSRGPSVSPEPHGRHSPHSQRSGEQSQERLASVQSDAPPLYHMSSTVESAHGEGEGPDGESAGHAAA